MALIVEVEHTSQSLEIPVQGDGTISRDVLGNRIMQLSVMFSSQFAFNSDIGNASYNPYIL